MSGEGDNERTSGAGEKIAMKQLEEECDFASTPPQAPPPVPSVALAVTVSPARVSQSPAESALLSSLIGEPLPLELPQPPTAGFSEELQPALSPIIAPERLPDRSPEVSSSSALFAEMALQAAINTPHHVPQPQQHKIPPVGVTKVPSTSRSLYSNMSSPSRKSRSPPGTVDAPRYLSTRRSFSATSVRSSSQISQPYGQQRTTRRTPSTFKRPSQTATRTVTRRQPPSQSQHIPNVNSVARSMNMSPSSFQGDVIAALEKELLEVAQQSYTSKHGMCCVVLVFAYKENNQIIIKQSHRIGGRRT